MNVFKRYSITVCFLLFIFSISINAEQSITLEIDENILYSTADEQYIVLDVYRPKGEVFYLRGILVHCGGWAKDEYRQQYVNADHTFSKAPK